MATLHSLRRAALLPLALSLALAGCASAPRHDAAAHAAAQAALAAAPTPAEWRPGEVWRFRSFDADGAVIRDVLLRITDGPANTCHQGEWLALERVTYPMPTPMPTAMDAPSAPRSPLGYLVEGRRLELKLSVACDTGTISGALDGARFEGTTSAGPFDGIYYRPVRVVAEHVPSPTPR